MSILNDEKDKYTDIIIINGIEVPYYKSNKDDKLIYANPKQLYKADIEGSVKQNLNIKDCSIEEEESVKNIYRMILVCGEYETPYVDELILEDYLKDEQKVLELIRKFPEVNKNHFDNDLPYLTIPLDDDAILRKYIEILRKSFKNHRKQV